MSAPDIADQLDHVTDLLRSICQPADLTIGSARLARGEPDNIRRVGQLTTDLGNRTGQLIGGDCCSFNVRRCFVKSVHRAFGPLGGVF